MLVNIGWMFFGKPFICVLCCNPTSIRANLFNCFGLPAFDVVNYLLYKKIDFLDGFPIF